MNLRLIIRSDKKRKSTGTGVFVKNSSGIRELQSIDEVKIYYPDFDLSNNINQNYSLCDMWSKEITYNLSYIASHIPTKDKNLYLYLWKPYEIGYNYLSKTYIENIEEAINYMEENQIDLKKNYSSDSYNELLEFTKSFFEFISCLKINYSDEYQIILEK